MNINTGEVLAMASYPSYELNSWENGKIDKQIWDEYNSKERSIPLLNRAIGGAYAPGSTFKMVTAIAALQTGNVTETEKINDTGVYPRGHNPTCWIYPLRHRGHGYLSLTEAIKQSCNYYFYEMGYRIGIETLGRYASDFGLGSKTGIELTGETAGTVASREVAASKGETWTVGYTLSASIGQVYWSFTPLQMAKYISILLNGGKQVNPSIIKTVINADGTEIAKSIISEDARDRLGNNENNNDNIEISESNLKAVMEGMKGVTSDVRRYSIQRIWTLQY